MLLLLLYTYCVGIVSSRKNERACSEYPLRCRIWGVPVLETLPVLPVAGLKA
jgi:hypothetical protein